MSATLKAYQQFVTEIGGELKTLGSRNTPVSVTLPLEAVKELQITVEDDYNVEVLWADTDAGMPSWEVMIILSDADVLVELARDLAGTPSYSVFGVRANVPFILCADDVLNTELTDGSVTTMDTIERVRVQRNTGADTGDAKVRALLLA